MKKIKKMISIAVLTIILLITVFSLPVLSWFKEQHGLVDGKLKPCNSTENCVCSENYSNRNLDSFSLAGAPADIVWQSLADIISTRGGEIRVLENKYLWATYTSKWMRFMDDFEARLDLDAGVIQIRSSSRVGRSDFGVNRRRVEDIVNELRKRLRSNTESMQ